MPRLVANMVVNGEWPRYLQSCLLRLRQQVDHIFVLSETPLTSEERSRYYSCGAKYLAAKPDEVPSFMEDEASYREFGWNAMIEAVSLKEDDWVLAIDSDQFWVGIPPRELMQQADEYGYRSVQVSVHEIFRVNPISERVDGFWGSITSVAMLKYDPYQEQTWRRRGMACGSFPNYVESGRTWNEMLEHYGRILHFGYANAQDREEKYLRYTGIQHNHSSTHIESIVRPGELQRWMGEVPEVWRGVK